MHLLLIIPQWKLIINFNDDVINFSHQSFYLALGPILSPSFDISCSMNKEDTLTLACGFEHFTSNEFYELSWRLGSDIQLHYRVSTSVKAATLSGPMSDRVRGPMNLQLTKISITLTGVRESDKSNWTCSVNLTQASQLPAPTDQDVTVWSIYTNCIGKY